MISSIPIPDPTYTREEYKVDFNELEGIISGNKEGKDMIEVSKNHFIATHDVKGLL